MSEESRANRRAFLKRTAKTAVYVAPVIRTLVAPQRASAQLSGKMMMANMGLMKGLKLKSTVQPPSSAPPWVPIPGDD